MLFTNLSFLVAGQRVSYYHHKYLEDDFDDLTAFKKAAAKCGYKGSIPLDRTRTFKLVLSIASQQVAAGPSSSSRTTSPVKILSSSSLASDAHSSQNHHEMNNRSGLVADELPAPAVSAETTVGSPPTRKSFGKTVVVKLKKLTANSSTGGPDGEDLFVTRGPARAETSSSVVSKPCTRSATRL